MTEPTMRERVARAIASTYDPEQYKWRDWIAEADAAIEAMRAPTSFVVCAVEAMAEERYRAAPEMQRFYGDDVWNAGVDAALIEPSDEIVLARKA